MSETNAGFLEGAENVESNGEELLKNFYESQGASNIEEALERTFGAANFILRKEEFGSLENYQELVEMAERNLVESLSGDSNVGRARDFFSSSRMVESISSFQGMSNYNELLKIAQNLLNNETEPDFDNNNSKIKAGKYFAKVKYKNRNGEEAEMGSVDDSTFRFRAYEDTTRTELERGIRGSIVSSGLHNFGMDVSRKKYPIGQKIEFTIYDESGNEVTDSS
ncbi:MAG: hypothetical protein HQ538_01050 [Parcubacteria group bacterium]|nr:hypothetical protein [Parcubacteria group bacterium]